MLLWSVTGSLLISLPRSKIAKRSERCFASILFDLLLHSYVTLQRCIWELKSLQRNDRGTGSYGDRGISRKSQKSLNSTECFFRVNSLTFHAQFVSQFHAERHKEELPLAAETVSKWTYMDDSTESMSHDSQGIELYKQLEELWNEAGMHTRKWMSNSTKVLEKIPIKYRASEVDINEDPLPMVKTLELRGYQLKTCSRSRQIHLRKPFSSRTEFPEKDCHIIWPNRVLSTIYH